MLPTLVPAMHEIGMLFSSRTFKTPRCANPREKPPPNARPSPVRAAGAPDHACSLGLASCVMPAECQPASSFPMDPASLTGSTSVLRLNSVEILPSVAKQYLLTSPVPSLYHCRKIPLPRFCSRQRHAH